MRLVALGLSLLLGGCTCRTGQLAEQLGELVVVVPVAGGDEVLTREASLEVGEVPMSEVGAFEVRLRNVGAAPLTLEAVERVGGSDTLSLESPAGLVLRPGVEVALAGRFAPPTDADATRATVEHRADFRVRVGDARPGEAEAAVSVLAVARARDCYVPALLDFGDVLLGHHLTRPFVLENGAALSASTTVSAIEGDDSGFFGLPGAGPFEVGPGARVEVPVSFGPLEARDYAARVRVRRAATCAEGVTQLRGRGSEEAVRWAPQTVDFGRVALGDAAARDVSVTSGAGVALALRGVAVEGDGFSLVSAPTEVPARGTAVIGLECRPAALGRQAGVLRFEVATVEGLPVQVPLSCAGGAPRIYLTPSPGLAFGEVPLGAPTSRRLSVQNVGTPPGFPGDTSSNLLLGSGGRPPYVAILPASGATLASDFQVNLPAGFDPLVGLPAVPGLNAVDLDVRLTASSGGRKEADLVVYSNDPKRPLVSVRVSAVSARPGRCDVQVTPKALTMGDIPRGATFEKTLTVTGGPNAEDCLVAVDMAPGSAPGLSVDALLPFRLGAGDVKTVKVRATATAELPLGSTVHGYVRVQPGDMAPVLVPVGMRVANCFMVSPPALDFGVTMSGCSSSALAVNAYNMCGVPLGVDAITVEPPGAPFVITSTLPPPGMQLFSGQPPLPTTVAFRPTAPGALTARLDFHISEGGAARTVSVPLAGDSTSDGDVTDRWTQREGSKLDILFVIDDSCSMEEEQTALASNLASFLGVLRSSQTEFQLGVTTTDYLFGTGQLRGTPPVLVPTTPSLTQVFASRVQVGTGGSGIEQPFAAAERALAVSGPLFLRPDAELAVVVVTDAEEQSPNTVEAYLAAYQAHKSVPEMVTVSVVGPMRNYSLTCPVEAIDDGRFSQMAALSGGMMTDICTSDWSRDLALLAARLSRPLTEFPLSVRPGTAVTVTIDGVPAAGWSYDATKNSVVFTQAQQPAAGSVVELHYHALCL